MAFPGPPPTRWEKLLWHTKRRVESWERAVVYFFWKLSVRRDRLKRRLGLNVEEERGAEYWLFTLPEPSEPIRLVHLSTMATLYEGDLAECRELCAVLDSNGFAYAD